MRKVTVPVMLSFVLIASAYGQSGNRHEDSVWVPPAAGTLLGGGYVHSGASKQTARAGLGAESPALRSAIAALDAQSNVAVDGMVLISTAVAMQTKVPVETVRQQHTATGMSYGELLIANTLAGATQKSFDAIVLMKAKSRSWGQLAVTLGVAEKAIIGRAQSATQAITYAQARTNRNRQQRVRELGASQQGNSQAIYPGG